MRKTMILATIILAIVAFGCAKEQQKPEEMGKELCERYNGSWNECSSPCLGTGAEICTAVCAAQCECGGIAGWECPPGYECRLTGKYADELGVCVISD